MSILSCGLAGRRTTESWNVWNTAATIVIVVQDTCGGRTRRLEPVRRIVVVGGGRSLQRSWKWWREDVHWPIINQIWGELGVKPTWSPEDFLVGNGLESSTACLPFHRQSTKDEQLKLLWSTVVEHSRIVLWKQRTILIVIKLFYGVYYIRSTSHRNKEDLRKSLRNINSCIAKTSFQT